MNMEKSYGKHSDFQRKKEKGKRREKGDRFIYLHINPSPFLIEGIAESGTGPGPPVVKSATCPRASVATHPTSKS